MSAVELREIRALSARGDHAAARRRCRGRLAMRPSDAAFVHAMGAISRAAGDAGAALAWFRRAAALAPASGVPGESLAAILSRLGRPDEAERILQRLSSLGTLALRGRITLVEALSRQGRAGAAARAAEAAIQDFPAACLLRYTEARLCHEAGDATRAIPLYRRAIALDPRHCPSYLNLAVATKRVVGPAAARPLVDRARLLAPREPLVHYGRALILLACGALAEGWEEYEWRWWAPGFPSVLRRCGHPAWDGIARPGARLLVWPEQGVADQITFASCVPDLVRTGQETVLECDPRLVPLFRRSFTGVAVRRLTHDGEGREHPSGADYDYHLPMGSLPRFFRGGLSAFPASHACLVPDPALVRHWRGRLAALGPGMKVGVAWRSGVADRARAHKYPALSAWRPVLSVPGVRFVMLQYGVSEAERREIVRELGVDLATWPDLDLKNDFDAVAALSACLDHVIACDGAPAIQAASVGAPVSMLYGPRDAYKFLGTDGLPWHPSVRVFAKEHWSDPWDRVMRDIADALAAAALRPPGAS